MQAAILRLIDGQKTVRDLIVATTVPTYELTAMLGELVESEAAAVRVPATTTQVSGAPRPASILTKLAVLLGTGLLIAISVYVGMKLWGDAFRAGP